MTRPADTSEKAHLVQFELLRRMSPEARERLVSELTVGVQLLAFAALRQRYPDAPDDELWLRLAARRLSPEIMRKVYGREYDPS